MTQRSLVTYIITLLLLCLTGSFTWAAAPTSLALTVSLASPTAVGTPVLLTATPNTPGALEYKFRTKYEDANGVYVWSTLQEYSTKNTCTWTPPEAHVYTIIAYTRLVGTAIPYLLYRDQLITVKPAVTDLHVVLSLTSPTAVGTPVKLSTTQVNGGTVEYRFRVKYQLPDTTYTWITLQEYSLLSTCIWTPAEAHPYILYVYAREKGRSVGYTVFKEIPYTVQPAVSSLQLTASCSSPTGVGTGIKLSASATGGGTLEYKFYATYLGGNNLQQIELIKDYSASSIVTWSPKLVVTYSSVVALVREKGRTVDFDQMSEIDSYTVVPAVSWLTLTASVKSPSPVGVPINLTASATGGGTLEYQFKAKYLSAPGVYAWITLQDYSALNTCTWTPAEARSYTIIAYAREKGTTVPYKVYRELAFTVNTMPVIFNIAPVSSWIGMKVNITGTNFTGASAVKFNGTTATFKIVDAATISATVPATATSGKITVTTPSGIATSKSDFAVSVLFGLKTNAKDNADMVWVPGNTFTMGNATGVGHDDEQPAHQVTLTGYWIYKYDVTVAQYRAFCTATGRALPQFPSGYYSWAGKTGWDDLALQQHPIVNVSWNDAKAYADWAGVKLPSEAQWEYAARGPQGRNYPWGGTATAADPYNGWDNTMCANYDNSYSVGKSTWPVGSFPAGASWCGAQDMAGNVWQWCGDWYGDYSSTAVTNPTGPATGTYRVLRGGSWDDSSYYRGACRISGSPGNYSGRIGFRCASLTPGP